MDQARSIAQQAVTDLGAAVRRRDPAEVIAAKRRHLGNASAAMTIVRGLAAAPDRDEAIRLAVANAPALTPEAEAELLLLLTQTPGDAA